MKITKVSKQLPAKLQDILPAGTKLAYQPSACSISRGISGKAWLVFPDGVATAVVQVHCGYDDSWGWTNLAWYAAARAAGYQV